MFLGHVEGCPLWSLLQKFRDCISACVHANGGGCGLYFRSSGTVLLHAYMQMEVAVASASEVQGLLLLVYMQMEVAVVATSEI